MNANPLLGVFLCWLGGVASASFYVPFRKVRGWSWETYWLVGGVMSWIIAPWFFAWLLTPDLLGVLHGVSPSVLLWTYFFGVLWGIGGLTFGLAVRYLGMSLGMALCMGNCAVFGTLIPPIFHGNFGELLKQRSGIVTLAGIAVCLVGIVFAGMAGISKENELTSEAKQASIKEFNLKLGLALGIFAGVMSACFAFGLDAGNPINDFALNNGIGTVWQGLPELVVVLLGGFTTNFIWCAMLNARNRSYSEYLKIPAAEAKAASKPPSMIGNYLFSFLAGAIWYMQFFFYTMGESQMGRYKFSSWTLLMASIIIFSTLWGIALKEWHGVSRRTKVLVALTLVTLVGSTVIVGYGNYLGSQ
jgi:L-rhamnose-H+ transport protein